LEKQNIKDPNKNTYNFLKNAHSMIMQNTDNSPLYNEDFDFMANEEEFSAYNKNIRFGTMADSGSS
jgi:hypothetical protein